MLELSKGRTGKDKKPAGRIRSVFSSKTATAVFAIGALILLGGGSVNGARAALTYYSEDYVARVSMDNVGVSILEDGARIAWRDYSEKSDGSWDEGSGALSLAHAEGTDGNIKIGKAYAEDLTVKNSGGIDAYVRVVVHKYWEDPDGKRRQDLDPGLIVLDGLGGDGWILDESASTDERAVLYYTKPLPVGRETAPFLSSVTAHPDIADLAVETETKDGRYTYIETTFPYDGVRIGLSVEADAVQTHNISQAAWSAWGRRVSITNSGELRLEPVREGRVNGDD